MSTTILEQPTSPVIESSEAPCLMTSKEMASFVSLGFHRMDQVIPKDLCIKAMDLIRSPGFTSAAYTQEHPSFDTYWEDPVLKQVMDVPKLKGAITSLVGKDPYVDGYCVHKLPANTHRGPNLHQDYEYIPFKYRFRILVAIYFHDVPKEMGGTAFLPGSHLRKVDRYYHPARYHHIKGMRPTVCKAGSVVIWHWGMWHKARSNKTSQDRYMLKTFLHPRVKQQRLWNTSDIDDASIGSILTREQAWQSVEGRAETENRIKLWRYLTNDRNYKFLWQPLDQYPKDSEFDRF